MADARLHALREPLLALHREILRAERHDMERFSGPLSGAEFLQVVTGSLRYSWLLPLSELIVAIDEALDDAAETEDEDELADPDALIGRLRALVAPPDAETAFGQQYLRLLQLAPGVVMSHAALLPLL
jgi:hypothetical protein